MKQFINDYKGLIIKPQMQFMKSHWKGFLAFYAIYGVCVYTIMRISHVRAERRLNMEDEE